MVKQKKCDYKIKLYKGLLVFLILSAVLFCMRYIEIPVTSDSEISYWDLILKLAGKPGIWTEGSVYRIISFGYCLPFSVLIRYGLSVKMIYKIAIIVNAIILSAMFWISGNVLRRILRRKNDSYGLETCLFLLFLFPIFYTQTVRMGPQVILAFVLLMIIDRVISIRDTEESSYKWLILWGTVGIFISPIFIGAVVGCIVIIVKQFSKGEKKNSVAGKAVLYLAGILLLIEAGEYVVSVILQDQNTLVTYSGLQSVWLVMQEQLNNRGMLGVIFVIVGKAVYLFINTGGMAFAGIYAMFFTEYKREFEIQTIKILTVSTFLMIALTSINEFPIDDMMSVLAILFVIPAVKYLYEKKYQIADIMKIIIASIVFSCICKDIWKLKEYKQPDWTSMGIISIGRKFCNNIYQLPVLAVVTVSIMFVSMCMLYKYYNKNGKIQCAIAGSSLLFIAVCSVWGYSQYVMPDAQQEYNFSYGTIVKLLKKTERPIYIYDIGDETDVIDPVKLFLQDNRIMNIRMQEDISILPQEAVLLTNHTEENDIELKKKYKKVYETDLLTVWENNRYRKDNLIKTLCNEEIQLPAIKTKNLLKHTYGSKSMLSAGEYRVMIQSRITAKRGKEIGRIVVGDDTGAFAVGKLCRTGEKGEIQQDILKFKSNTDMKNFRIVIDQKNFTEVEIQKVTVTRVGEKSNAEKKK